MAGEQLFLLTKEQVQQNEERLAQWKKILDNDKALVASGVMTQAQIDDLRATYTAIKTLVERYKPKL